MGLKLNQEINNTGLTGDYHRIANFSIDVNAVRGITNFALYASKESRDAGKNSLAGIRDEFSLMEVVALTLDEPVVVNNGLEAINLVKKILYTIAKSHSGYSTAEDVIENVFNNPAPVEPEPDPAPVE